MTLIDQIHRLERLDRLIRMKATGTPQNLACRLAVSERTVYNLIDVLRSIGAEVYFNAEKQSYCYGPNIEVEIKFKVNDNAVAYFKGGARFCCTLVDTGYFTNMYDEPVPFRQNIDIF